MKKREINIKNFRHGSQSMNKPFSHALKTLVEANLVFALVNDKLNFEPC
jgi:hypothetical protein